MPNQLCEKLASVGSDVAASSADFRRVDQHTAKYGMLRTQLDALDRQFSALVTTDLRAFAAKAARLGMSLR